MNFNVIIPVVHSDMCDDVIQSIEQNSIHPKRIIIIDNTKDRDYKPSSNSIPIDVYHSEKGLVNESWNLGISKVDIRADYVTILNDDIFLNSYFFQRIIETFKKNGNCGVACPKTVLEKEEIAGKGVGRQDIVMMKKREGWAFTIRKGLLDHIAPIPSHRVTIFHGDDWFWYWTKTRGNYWYKDRGNLIWHKVGASVKSLSMRKFKKEERNEWRRVMGELGG